MFNLYAQQTPENFDFYGYARFMQSADLSNSAKGDALIHNRINFKGYLNEHWNIEIGLRTRIMWGNSVNSIPNYAQFIDADGMDIDLGNSWITQDRLVAHSTIDRLYSEYQSNKWHIVVGRQRINWGKNMVWNPNDIFNAYNFFDFDYAERPGSDAIRIQYYLSGDASIEVAVNRPNEFDKPTRAIRYSFHKNLYDWQLLFGQNNEDMVMGIGWEGVVKTLGFKGEMSYFIPTFQDPLLCGHNDDTKVFTASLSMDYFFKNGWYVLASNLYNSNGIDSVDSFESSAFGAFRLNAKQLMPNKNSYLLQFSRTLGASTSVSLTGIYAKELKGYYAMPQIGYSAGQNWQLDLVSQLFYSNAAGDFGATSELVFLRAGYSF